MVHTGPIPQSCTVQRGGSLRLGVVLLNADHATETLSAPDPFNVAPPAGLPPGFFGHRDFWRVPTVYAVAENATGPAILDGDPMAIADVVEAVERLAPHCDLIVGSCGYFHAAQPLLSTTTATLLSGLSLLPNALASTAAPIGVLTYNQDATIRLLAGHPERDRIRIAGVDHLSGWSAISLTDWVTHPRWTVGQLRAELLATCQAERDHGVLAEVGAVILECTVMPQFRSDIARVLAVPVWDVAAVAKTLLGA